MFPNVLLFDAVGTLIEPDPPVAVAYAAAGRRFGSSFTEEDIVPRFRTAFARQEERDVADATGSASEGGERARWRTIVGEVFDDVADVLAIFDVLWQHFAQPEHWRLIDGAAEAWQRLAARPSTLHECDTPRLVGIASNFDARLARVCAGHSLLAGAPLFISSQLGHRKPHIAFFRAIESRLDLPPEQILLVGDDLANDYRGALAAGWQAVLVDRNDRFPGTRRVKSLRELAEALGVGNSDVGD
jgi:putative hydrolase of the HAD superfamily